jgi:hypothetical protein
MDLIDERVVHHDVVALRQQKLDNVGADETGTPGYKNPSGHIRDRP